MLEFIMSFPLILMLILAAVQLAHIWVARTVVHYAAYCAARACIVSQPSEYAMRGYKAAQWVCAWINVGEKVGASLPGWGNIPGSGGVAANTSVTITEDPRWNVRAEVRHKFGLITPIIGPLMANAVSPQLNLIPTETGDWGTPYPQITLREIVILPKPYRCVMPAN